MMNRREFLQALGLAAGASVLPVATQAQRPSVLPAVEAVALPAPSNVKRQPPRREKKGDGVQVQIDGKWYTLNNYSLDLSVKTMTVPWGDIVPIQRDWTFEGSTFDSVSASVFSPVPVLFLVDGREFSGEAMFSDFEMSVNRYEHVESSFVLRGIGPLAIN